VQDPEAERPPRDKAAADVAHELGNRLAAIVAVSHLIRTDPRLPGDLHEKADLLVEEADRTRILVEALLDRENPRAESAAPDLGREPAPLDGGRPARILVVDDEAAIRDFLARILQRSGYEVFAAADGADALKIVRSATPPDAILCDHRMAGMTGPAFHDAVVEVSPGLARRFAFMSGDIQNPTLRDLAAARGVVLLAKPFDMETVARTVGDLVRSPAP
jgi:CheY-like chemotaxis protein